MTGRRSFLALLALTLFAIAHGFVVPGAPWCSGVVVSTKQRETSPSWTRRTSDPTETTSGTARIAPVSRTTKTTTQLYSSLESKIDFVLNPEKDLLTKAYRRGTIFFGALAALLFIIPDRTASAQLATKFGGAAGYGLAGGLCHILAGANDKDRLSSDTYTRLNVGLLGFTALGILFVPAEAGFFPSAVPAIALSLLLTLGQGYGILLSFLGWKRGVDPAGTVGLKNTPQHLVEELRDGTTATLKGLRVDNTKKALAYRNALLLVGFGIFSSIMEGFFNFRYREALNRSWFEVSLQGSKASRLFMIATVIYSLKDAAERDRLTGTTFIQLNTMLGLWAFTVGIGQAIYPLGFALYRGVEMFSFSLLFFTKALKSQVQKREAAKQKRLEQEKEEKEAEGGDE